MNWYLVFTKPRQECRAFENLQFQGFECYLPLLLLESTAAGAFTIQSKPLFPRYLFIRLGHELNSKSWAPIRSTKGVSNLVSFGGQPAKVDDELVIMLKEYEANLQNTPQKLFVRGERVRLVEGPFTGLEAIYQISDGERRVMVLIEMLSKPVKVYVAPTSLRKLP
ncbi:MAG: transcription/translation regulatory transformer protein RfaH [Flavobacteriia bacterium]|nr:transcription/translation regulatory transformer protein RfaH [Flavobacteriia bacterium]